MNPKLVEFHVNKDSKTNRTAKGKKKNDTSSTTIPQEDPHKFEIELGGDDYLDLWVESGNPEYADLRGNVGHLWDHGRVCFLGLFML